MKRHKFMIHNIGDYEIYKCDVKDCDFTSKQKENIIKHKWNVHDININNKFKYFVCTVQNCDYKCKVKSSLNKHLWITHDKGKGEIYKV